MRMRGLVCPNCGTDHHRPDYENLDLYICKDCGRILGYLCIGCERLYQDNQLVKIGENYVCRFCGDVQPGYTRYKKGEETK